MAIKLTFYGAASEVGRSCFLLEAEGKKILLDAGIKLGVENESEMYPTLPEEIMPEIDAIIVSHAHIDHTAYVPFIVKKGFCGKIYITKPSRDIMHLLLSDAIKIARLNNRSIYSEKEVKKVIELSELLEFDEEKEIFPGIILKFLNAGHILGSAQVFLKISGKNLLYTGDVNLRETNLLEKAELPKEKIDVLITENTYGHEAGILPSHQKVSKELADIIKATIGKKGKVLIPVFAVGRGQEVMFVLENYISSGYLPELTIYVDGMINKANRIHRHNVIYLKKEISNRILVADDDPFKSKFVKVPKTRNKEEVMEAENVVILATSGMLSGGPSITYLQKLASDGKNTIVLVGYQSKGTLGRKLIDGAKEIEIEGQKLEIKAEIRHVKFSGHADFQQLREFVRAIDAAKVFLVHGEKFELPASLGEQKGKEFIIPKMDECYEV